MLRALVEDLLSLQDIELYVPLDWRLFGNDLLPVSNDLHIVEVIEGERIEEILSVLIAQCEAVWPVAPESDHILSGICKFVEGHGKLLLSSSFQATELTSNKFDTYTCLTRFNIATVATELFSEQTAFSEGEWVLKPIDGVGCEGGFLIKNNQDYQQVRCAVESLSDYVIQPYIRGKNLSLSCLFKHGRGWLLCCNQQQISVVEREFLLTECQVNIHPEQHEKYRKLIDDIAAAIPGLWGYAGIDLIEAEQGLLVLEINPRLTTSYAGIRDALGMNVAENVLQLIHTDPELKKTRCRQVNVKISGKQAYAS